jgi:enolase
MRINSLELREIIDSRTQPTVEAEINDNYGKAPSGASTGEHEAKCFVPENLDRVEKKMQKLEGENLSQEEFDEKLKDIDGTDDFSEIGAAAISSRKRTVSSTRKTFRYL